METTEQTLDEILNLAAAHFKVPREKLSPDDDFFKTLGIDSLQTLDLLTTGESFPGRAAGLRTAGRDRFPHIGGQDSGALVDTIPIPTCVDCKGTLCCRARGFAQSTQSTI